MKRSSGWVGLMALVLCLSVVAMTGCAKKVGLQEAAMVKPPVPAVQAPPAVQPPPAVKPPAVQPPPAAKAPAVQPPPAMKAPAAQAPDDSAAKKAAAILKELQIADVNFDFDKYNLKPLAQTTLKNAAPAWLKYRDYKLVIEGHCDERGTAEYNLALGEKRATEAAKFLTDLGIEKERIKTISYGEEMPLDKGHTEEAWAKNRRARFVIFPPVK